MKFKEGKIYSFKVKNKLVAFTTKAEFQLIYLRYVGKTHLFKSVKAPWNEGFTREQLADFVVSEVSNG